MYNDNYYLQLSGTTMGGHSSAALACLVMNYIITKALRQLGFMTPIAACFFDDLIPAIPLDKLPRVLDVFNSVDHTVHIKFTHEVELSSSLPFLDITIIRTPEGSIIINWYTKSIASGGD